MMTSKVFILIILEVIFYKSSPKTSKIDLLFSMNSFKETITMVSVPVTSKVFLRLLKENKKKEEIYKY
jgi:hypothetical protein